MKQIQTLIYFGVLLVSAFSFGQDTLPISKAEIWQKASDKNTQLKLAQQNFLQTERTKEYLELEVNKAFMQLQLSYKAVSVLTKANTTAKANLQLVENYFAQGI